jgi:hypothetical protein
MLASIALAGCRREVPAVASGVEGPMTLAVPQSGAYTGAYIDFGDTEDDVTLEQIEEFEGMVGKHQAIVASSSYWGEQRFPMTNLQVIWRHGAVPLVFWSPWDKPYAEDAGPDQFSLPAILEGKWDAYIDAWADGARQFGHPMMVSFANEANGNWFPWSGWYYGAGKTLVEPGAPEPLPTPPPKWAPPVPVPYQGPEMFKKAYRYVVDRVRARGARNVLWVFHAMNYSIPQEYWNMVQQYYPGSDYVDWIGLSVYGQQYEDDRWSPFLPLLEWPLAEVSRLDPSKPLMLAEWGVGEFLGKGSKAAFVAEAFETMRVRFPQVKAAVFWHERWQNEEGGYSNLRVNSSPESLAAYRQGVADPFWLDRPILKPLEGSSSPLPAASSH